MDRGEDAQNKTKGVDGVYSKRTGVMKTHTHTHTPHTHSNSSPVCVGRDGVFIVSELLLAVEYFSRHPPVNYN